MLSTQTNNGYGGEITEFHHPDRLGTKLVTNNQANTSFEQSILPFGTSLDAETSGITNQRFTSYDRNSATGSDYAVNRSYSSAQSRFTQVDPIGMNSASIGNPQSNNLYAYVQNNPVDFTDPSGLLMRMDCHLIAFGVPYGDFRYDVWQCVIYDDGMGSGGHEPPIRGGGGTGGGGTGDLEKEVDKRLNSGDCRQKLNDVLKALLKNKGAGKTGIDELVKGFFTENRVIETTEGLSEYDFKNGNIVMNVNSEKRGIGIEFIHEALHGARRSSFSHEAIFRAMAKVDGINFKKFKKDRSEQLKNQNSKNKDRDSAMYRDAMNSWINKHCGG